MNGPYLIIAFVALIALFYFMTIRPQRKQAEKQREMHNSIEPGTRVMLTSGIYGTVTAIGDKQFVLELAPGVDITVLKQAIVRTVAPDDEEFEFADSTAIPDDASSLSGPVLTEQGSADAPAAAAPGPDAEAPASDSGHSSSDDHSESSTPKPTDAKDDADPASKSGPEDGHSADPEHK